VLQDPDDFVQGFIHKKLERDSVIPMQSKTYVTSYLDLTKNGQDPATLLLIWLNFFKARFSACFIGQRRSANSAKV
jgi:hypothetical protein